MVGTHLWKFESCSSVFPYRGGADIQTNWSQANLRHDRKWILTSQIFFFFLFSQTENKNKKFSRIIFGTWRKTGSLYCSFSSHRNQGCPKVEFRSLYPLVHVSGRQQFPDVTVVNVSTKSKATRLARNQAVFKRQAASALAAY